MPPKASYSTPMFHVADIETSIRFYELLGFTPMDTDRGQPLGWARLHCDGGAVMFLRAEQPVDASAQAVILVMYTPRSDRTARALAGQRRQSAFDPLSGIHAQRRNQHHRSRRLSHRRLPLGEIRAGGLGETDRRKGIVPSGQGGGGTM